MKKCNFLKNQQQHLVSEIRLGTVHYINLCIISFYPLTLLSSFGLINYHLMEISSSKSNNCFGRILIKFPSNNYFQLPYSYLTCTYLISRFRLNNISRGFNFPISRKINENRALNFAKVCQQRLYVINLTDVMNYQYIPY